MSDSPEETARQTKIMREAGSLDLGQFLRLRESERRQVVRATAIQSIKENAAFPLRDVDSLDYGSALRMAETLSVEPSDDPLDAMRESGIVLHEAAKPADSVLTRLSMALPSHDPDSEIVQRLMGVEALSPDQEHEVQALAAKHADLLAESDEPTREAMRALREAGIPTTGHVRHAPESDEDDGPTLTPAAQLAEAGIPLKGSR